LLSGSVIALKKGNIQGILKDEKYLLGMHDGHPCDVLMGKERNSSQASFL
jgi:hypothetical protein